MRRLILSVIIAATICCSAVAQSSGSKPLDISMLLLTLQGYQQTNMLGQPNGYVPLSSNSLISPSFLFPSFSSATDGTFWSKSGSTLAPISGLSISSNSLSFSKVGVGLIDPIGIYGIKIDNANDPLVLKGGNVNRIYIARQNTIGGADSGYNNFVWSINNLGNFTFPSGTIQTTLSMNGGSITNVGQILKQNGLQINLSNRTISGSGNSISFGDNVIVPAISLSNIQNNATASSYALNAYTANQLYTRIDQVNDWSSPQNFLSISLENPLPVASGGTGGTNKEDFLSSFGLVVGSTIQGYSPILQAIVNPSGVTNNSILMWRTNQWISVTPEGARSNLGLKIGLNVQGYSTSLQTISSSTNAAANSTLIWGGSSWSVKTPEQARSSLGVAIGTNVQAYSSLLDGFLNTNNRPIVNNTLIGNGSKWVSTAPEVARLALGLGSAALYPSSAFQLSSVNLIHLSSNNAIYLTNFPTLNQNTTGKAENVTGVVAIGHGGTGATTDEDARDNLGLGTAATRPSSAFQPSSTVLSNLAQNNGGSLTNIQAAGDVTGIVALANGGTGANNATQARTNLGIGSAGTNPASAFQAASTNLTTLSSNNGINLTNLKTVPIANGGTGATNAIAARTNLGLSGGITAIKNITNGSNVISISISNGLITGWAQAVQ